MMSVALVTRPKSTHVSFMGRWSIWYTSPARWMILYVFCTQFRVRPKRLPATVPTTPMSMPATRNTPPMLPALAPMAFRIPISFRFSATSTHNDAEARHGHDDRDDDEEGELLELQGGEEVPVHPHPVPQPESGARDGGDAPADSLRVERIVALHLDAGDALTEPGELLGG